MRWKVLMALTDASCLVRCNAVYYGGYNVDIPLVSAFVYCSNLKIEAIWPSERNCTAVQPSTRLSSVWLSACKHGRGGGALPCVN
jgi:hypothetical protein